MRGNRCATVSTPIWGKLADMVDRKLLVQLALAIVVIGSALAGFSQARAPSSRSGSSWASAPVVWPPSCRS
jgi:MFS family permease